jgi:hypothetical protein
MEIAVGNPRLSLKSYSVLRQLVQIALATAFLLPCVWGDAIYNYESYGNTLSSGVLNPPSGLCSSQTFVSVVLSETNCSPASGVIASADSLATYSTLHADSSLSLSGANLPNGIGASGYARTVDSLEIDTPGVAFIGFTFDVDGSLVNSGLTNAFVTLNFGFAYDTGFAGQAPDACQSDDSGGLTTISFTCNTRLYPVSLFEQNTYWFSISAQESLAPSIIPVSGSASASFFSTATIISVQPYDANMDFIPDAIISSEGNDGNPFVDAVAPEPSSLFLLAGGLALVALGRVKGGSLVQMFRHCTLSRCRVAGRLS